MNRGVSCNDRMLRGYVLLGTIGVWHNVFIVCSRAGRSRSVSIAIAYLMHKHGMSFEGALAQIMESRPNADPNKAFVAQLKQLNEVLKNGKL